MEGIKTSPAHGNSVRNTQDGVCSAPEELKKSFGHLGLIFLSPQKSKLVVRVFLDFPMFVIIIQSRTCRAIDNLQDISSVTSYILMLRKSRPATSQDL